MAKYPRQNKLVGKLAELNVTYTELADAIGKSAPTVSAIINGQIDMKLSISKKIIAYLNKKSNIELSIDDIID